MNATTYEYTDFSSVALIKIFQLADILKVTPKRATEIYIAEKSKIKAAQTKPAA